ncbi:MAG: acylphosphatase [Sphaerobacter sp.]|nr:acylphosphatase [Sphaerobacter sp.]
MPETQARLHCVVYGRVQGVGFRAYAVSVARELGITGWVRNRQDGRSVETEAEGTAEQLERFRAALRIDPPGAVVERMSCEWLEPGPGYPGFTIRR